MRLRDKRTLILAVVVMAVAIFGYRIIRWRPRPPAPTQNVNTTNRQQYSALYDAAWRQDSGTEPTLITATVLVPPAIEVLGKDTGRSVTEEQQWNAVKNLKSNQLAFIITADSVANAVPDDVFLHGLSLTIAGGPTTTFTSWNALIAPSRVTNPTNSTSSQLGVAIFDAARSLDWNTFGAMTLNLKGISGERDRTFTWTTPSLLLQVQ